jgi:hypothetical protein
MSKYNNVNPNFYKDGGRDHTEGPDKGDVHEEPKQAPEQQKRQGKEGQPNFIPGEKPVGEK